MDNRRSSYIRRLFGVDWLDPANYDLSIDTGRVDISTAVDLIELASRRRVVTGSAPAGPDETLPPKQSSEAEGSTPA
jgi:hypothetical protein